MSARHLVIMAAGTGGHIMPGLAVADEMKRRVSELVGGRSDRMWVQTFHSACLRMLRAHSDVLGYQPGFSIYDTDEGRAEVERIMKDRVPGVTEVVNIGETLGEIHETSVSL